MTIFQILILVFIFVVILKAIIRLSKKDMSIWLFLLWLVFWLLIGVISLFPVVIERLAEITGIGRGVDLMIYVALFVSFYVVFRQQLRINALEKNLTNVVRKIAITKARKK